ncbi:hypothetical protein NO995_17140 [Aestuariibaculum sp. M13]|uniref:hypothetical protein n=1 Tax=Aestuariibaculum sp. M13 TaxID=2967132 RepID=UPI002159F6E6|nr:hypothetical protein [Aestuariibaculum sp. M13]MCR8669413.1 hypothetical protein [Aestuariibaculum sp. M13]
MKYNLILILLTYTLIGYSQNKLTDEIDKYVKSIDSNSELKVSEYDWNKITESHVDHGAILRIWKTKNQIVKVEEQFEASYGRCTRLIYLKNNKPIKGVELEENFEFKNNEIDYSDLSSQFKMQVYVIGFNDLIDEYEFEAKEEGQRKVTEPYCDFNDLFAILDEITDL